MTNSELNFTFQPVTKNQISKFIKLLNNKQAVQSIDIPIRLIKEFCEFFSGLGDFKEVEFHQILKKMVEEQINQIIDQLLFFLMFQNI